MSQPMAVQGTRREIPPLAEVEVLVAGGGLSGVAAAVAAARNGAKTLLVERSSILGGVATAGLMASITNFYYTDRNELVVGGIATEVVDRLAELGGTTKEWRSRSCPHYTNDPEIFKVLLIDMVLESGAQVLLDTWVVDTLVEDGALRGVIVETKGGPRAIRALVSVDTTGDADLACRAGAPYRYEPTASSSLEFRMGNVDLQKLFQYFMEHPSEYPTDQDIPTSLEQLAYHWRERGLLFVPHGAGRHMQLVQEAIARGEYQRKRGVASGLDAFGMYGLAKDRTAIINSNFEVVDYLDPWERSQAIVDAQRSIPHIAEFLRSHMPGFQDAYVAATASELGIRGTRWIEGDYVLTEQDVLDGVRFPDVVGMGAYRKKFGDRLLFLPHGFDIPYRVMLPQGIEGLLVSSGKSTSSSPRGLLRGQARCLQLGEAGGAAAALAARSGVPPRALDIRALQQRLLAQGVYLGDAQMLRERGLS
ncbi:MAG: FAD-dependent oxidoreductase [Anaerolineaceae bacterium]|nr:FAD-dependent oxidoreductase [Anaerolineaceae bacterium]